MKYGPQARELEILVVRISSLSQEEYETLVWEHNKSVGTVQVVKALEECFSALSEESRQSSWEDLRTLIRNFMYLRPTRLRWDTVKNACNVCLNATLALLMRDKISDKSFRVLHDPWKRTVERG